MRLLTTLPRGVRRLFRLPASHERMRHDLDDEIRFHIESCIAASRAAGLSEAEACSAAIARFGDSNDLRTYCDALASRRARRIGLRDWFDAWMQDARFALRQLARAPGFTAMTITMLALGVGANAAIFSVVHHLLIAPLPFADGGRMVELMMTSGGGQVFIMPNPEIIARWRARTRTVDHTMGFWSGEETLGDTAQANAERVSYALIQPAALDFVGARPVIGRAIEPSDTLTGAGPVVMLGHGFWTRRFAASAHVLGTTILLDGVAHTIVGVMPEGFFVPFAEDARDVFVAMPAGTMGNPTMLLAMLRPGVTADAANRELASMFPVHTDANPYDDPPRVMRAVDFTRSTTREIVLVLFGAVSFVLLIACANVANLLLARAWARHRELAVRAALGAGRGRLVRQMFTESMVLAVIAGALGTGVAYGTLHLIIAAQPPKWGTLDGVRIERAVLWWSLGVSILTGLLFGAAPALFAADQRLGDSLKSTTRAAAGSRATQRFRGALVVLEVALSVVLLCGAGLLMRTVVALRHIDVGFDPRGLAGVSLRFDPKHTTDPLAIEATTAAIRAELRATPGIQGVAMSTAAPPDFGIAMGAFEIEGRQTSPRDTVKVIGFASVDTNYFRLVGLPVTRGRLFAPIAPTAKIGPAAELMINESMARRFWPNGNALGARVRRGTQPQWSTIVGIVGDVAFPTLNSVGKDLQMYMAHHPGNALSDIVVRSRLSASATEAVLKKAAHRADPTIRVSLMRRSEDYIAHVADMQRFVLTLLGDFALLAVVLAAIGLYGVIAYSVTQRTREIGVRVALGAQATDVIRLVVGKGVALAMVGIAIGTIGAVLATRALASWLYGVRPGDPVTLVIVAVALLVVAVLSTLGPARRAAGLDPVEALRAE